MNTLRASSPTTVSVGRPKALSTVRRAPRPSFSEELSQANERSSRGAAFESMKVVILALLDRIETLEKLLESRHLDPLDLRHEVSQFEAALIKAALMNTKGRQRRAARMLGMKVSTLNAKIHRYHVGILP
jgi:DNA-binding NtrC family response regulator